MPIPASVPSLALNFLALTFELLLLLNDLCLLDGHVLFESFDLLPLLLKLGPFGVYLLSQLLLVAGLLFEVLLLLEQIVLFLLTLFSQLVDLFVQL